MRLKFYLLFLVLIFSEVGVVAQKPPVQGTWNQLFAGYDGVSDYKEWMKGMESWRAEEKRRLKYDDSGYLRKATSWSRSNFIFLQVMAHDRFLYDHVTNEYTVDKFLKDVEKRYGGVDGVLLWPTYPNMGIDDRNQFDLFECMPGGLEGVRSLIDDFHKRGVRVFIPIMFWDHGTREITDPMYLALVKELKEIGADGLTGDTMHGIPVEYKDASDSIGYPTVLQPELTIYDYKMLEWNTLSWNYFWPFTRIPGVSIYKWFEPKHQIHVTNRWAVDKTDDLQYAFFNGIGYNPWENIWGIWNRIPDRYAEAIRRIALVYRSFPDVWSSEKWTPFFPTLRDNVFASSFPHTDKTVITLINRDSADAIGAQLKLPYTAGEEFYDIWNGVKLATKRTGDSVYLSFPIEAHGFGAVLITKKGKPDKVLGKLLAVQKERNLIPLNSISDKWEPLTQSIVAERAMENTISDLHKPDSAEMVFIPAAEGYKFEAYGVMIEGDELPTAVGVQRPWQKHPSRNQSYVMDMKAFYMDKYPVTNKQFKQFIDASGYRPMDDHNYLRDWTNGSYPSGWDNKPVTWVSLEDAGAYAEWAGKRLPHEWEWQYAAQGQNGFLYPWGNEFDSSFLPVPDTSRSMRPPTDVDAFPQGAGVTGVVDMVGNVWQWTDEYRDAHTRFAVLKGGGYYRPVYSHWYFPRALELNKYGKYLLMSPGMDRSGGIGFRCVKDISDKK